MTTIKRFTPDYKMHAVRFEAFAREAEHGEFVKFSDYEALVSELASSRQINAQTLQIKLTMAETIKELTDRVNALDRQLSMSEAKCKGYFSDAAAALVKCDALEVLLRNALSSEQESIQRAHAANQTIDALAVESIGLRHIAERIVNALYAAGYEPEENSLHPWKSLIFDAEKALETPATDAALAAIQAQGVEKSAAALDALSAQSASATTQANFRAAAVYLRAEVLPAIGEAK
ncbi:hypothetical protein PTR41_14630 [Serratia bockelmannii]|uniref:hypothetical protein n=1 Tax=Serratia bockelmannii TaxID=2703793 RepID=UPI00313C1727